MTKTEQEQLYNLYTKYFSNKDCTQLTTINNNYSKADAFLLSGKTESTVLIEYKNRTGSVSQYDSALLEKKKYEALLAASSILDCAVLYVMEFEEVVLIYSLNFKKEYETKTIGAPASSWFESTESKQKECILLPYSEAVIVSKKTYNQGTFEQLSEYIKSKQWI